MRTPRTARLVGMPNTTSIATVDDAHFAAEVLESDVPVLVDFTAAWCPPCRMMHPILEDVASARDDVRIVQVDVDEQQEAAARYGILSMPTFVLFRGGQEILRMTGARPRRRLEQELDAVL